MSGPRHERYAAVPVGVKAYFTMLTRVLDLARIKQAEITAVFPSHDVLICKDLKVIQVFISLRTSTALYVCGGPSLTRSDVVQGAKLAEHAGPARQSQGPTNQPYNRSDIRP